MANDGTNDLDYHTNEPELKPSSVGTASLPIGAASSAPEGTLGKPRANVGPEGSGGKPNSESDTDWNDSDEGPDGTNHTDGGGV